MPDAHWVSLRPEMEGFIVPSKFYAAAAVGRPIVAVVDAEGELAEIVRRHDCGLVVSPGDRAALAAAVLALRDDPARRERMGGNARAMIEREFPRRQALDAWTRRIEQVARAAKAPAFADDIAAHGLAVGSALPRKAL